MNERIQELVEEARTHWAKNNQTDKNRQEPGLYYHVDVVEKFAELIVRECARVYWNIDDGETHTEYVEALKEHFGVEE